MGEVVAVHAVAVLDVADDRFDGGPAFHLALDGRGDAAFLAGGEDAQLVDPRGVVPLVSGIGEDALEGGAGGGLDLGDD